MSISLIGLGPMGQAMVAAFRAAGVEVTVWNRSTAKIDAAVRLGAERAETVAAAVDANEVIVLSLTHYAAMYDVLGQASGQLAGKVIVNLSSDTPENTRAAAKWVRAQGGEFLTGGVMAQAEGLTNPESYVFYSGPEEVFQRHRELLRPIGPAEYLGADDGLAQLHYQAVLAIFLPLLLGYEQALAMIDRSGADIDRFVGYAQRSLGQVDGLYAGFAAMAKAGGGADAAYLRMMDAGARHVVATGDGVGVDMVLADAVSTVWGKAIATSERSGQPVSTYALLRGDAA